MTDKAQIERLTQLTRAAQGKTNGRSTAEILAAEKLAAANFIVTPQSGAPAPETPPAE